MSACKTRGALLWFVVRPDCAYFYQNIYVEIKRLYEIYLSHPSVQTDTRKLKAGDLFFALSGTNFNGNAFAAQALALGAAYAVVDQAQFVTDERCILVPDVLLTLQQLAQHHRRQFDIPFIAITGSNGKTTTKELIAAVLRRKFTTYATDGNLNNHIGVPLTLLKIRNDAQMAIIEMGANHLLEIAGYCRVALPTHGIINNCGRAHLEGFGSEEGVRRGKGELYDFIRDANGAIFINSDLDYLETMSTGIRNKISYGHSGEAYAGHELNDQVQLAVQLERPVSKLLPTHLVGGYNFPNVMAAVAVGMHFGVDIEQIAIALDNYLPDNSRSQLLQKGNNTIILDAYNANPSSMHEAILNFAQSKMDRKVLWLGGMKEMGTEEVAEHTRLTELIAQYSWADVWLVGHEFNGIAPQYRHFDTSTDALAYLKDHHPDNCAILIKGSRGSKMEALLEGL